MAFRETQKGHFGNLALATAVTIPRPAGAKGGGNGYENLERVVVWRGLSGRNCSLCSKDIGAVIWQGGNRDINVLMSLQFPPDVLPPAPPPQLATTQLEATGQGSPLMKSMQVNFLGQNRAEEE